MQRSRRGLSFRSAGKDRSHACFVRSSDEPSEHAGYRSRMKGRRLDPAFGEEHVSTFGEGTLCLASTDGFSQRHGSGPARVVGRPMHRRLQVECSRSSTRRSGWPQARAHDVAACSGNSLGKHAAVLPGRMAALAGNFLPSYAAGQTPAQTLEAVAGTSRFLLGALRLRRLPSGRAQPTTAGESGWARLCVTS